MKKFIFAIFVAFWASVGTIMVMEAITPDSRILESRIQSASFTIEEVAEHDHLTDCWMMIEDDVYDLTDYIDKHPTPASILAPWCGRDATEGMRTKGIGRDHSPAAWRALETYRIGTVAPGE